MVASNPPGENISSGGPSPATSYRVLMPSITANGISLRVREPQASFPPDLPPRPDVVTIGSDGVERHLRDIGISVGPIVERGGHIANRVHDRSYASVEPRT